MMKKYHKINTAFMRDGKRIREEFTQEEYGYLRYNEWVGNEKIDGTNIRIHWNRESGVQIGGRDEESEIPARLLTRLNELVKTFDEYYNSLGEDISDVTLYGEGYGQKILNGGHRYISNGVDFILFDVTVTNVETGEWVLRREKVDEIAQTLGIKSVPVVFTGNLLEAIEMVKGGFKSVVAETEMDAEGLVLTPKADLFTRSGERVVTKLKTKDFRKVPDFDVSKLA